MIQVPVAHRSARPPPTRAASNDSRAVIYLVVLASSEPYDPVPLALETIFAQQERAYDISLVTMFCCTGAPPFCLLPAPGGSGDGRSDLNVADGEQVLRVTGSIGFSVIFSP